MNPSILEKSVDALLSRRSDAPLIRDFTASKQAELFETLKQLRFNGQLVLTSLQGRNWIVHLHQGLIVYATGGEHPVKRWKRNLIAYSSQVDADISTLERELASAITEFNVCWQYQLLHLWVEKQKITEEQAARIVWAGIVEVLFDITQAMKVTYELKPGNLLTKRLVFIEPTQAIAEAERLWRTWQAAKLGSYSPNNAPIIKQPAELQQTISTSTYRTLSQLLDGQQTLRDVAIQMKRDIVTTSCSLLPYIQAELVELINIADLPTPVFSSPTLPDTQEPLIACIDDSPWICQIMDKVLTSANYRFVGVNDALRAIGVLLALKPDLIFLDLMMPNTNGYELCSRLRQIALFRHTPIVILTGNDAIIDRVKAKIVGSTDFIGKPVDAKKVLNVIQKHLKRSAAA